MMIKNIVDVRAVIVVTAFFFVRNCKMGVAFFFLYVIIVLWMVLFRKCS